MRSIRTIRLIEPKAAGYHVYSRILLPRLGLPILGAMLKQKGYDVRIYCQDIQDIDYADLHGSDLVGISITTSTAPEGYRIAERLRERQIPVVMGGPHATSVPDEVLEHAPYCIRGEGEHALVQLVECLSQGADPKEIPGLSYMRDGCPQHNPRGPLIADLDSLPMPDMDLIHGSSRIRITPVSTSRGCPHDCTFCSVTDLFGHKYRFRGTESVVDELSRAMPRKVFFYDDNFAAHRPRTKALLEEIIRRGFSFTWTAQARTDVAKDKELLKLMRRSNCLYLYIGFESVNPETLKAFNKRQEVMEIEECIGKLHEHGIMVHGMFITGADQDDEQTIRDTVEFALRNGIDTVQFSMLTPIPGTRLYSELDAEDRIFTKDWSVYDGHHVVFEPKNMTPYTLQKETFKATKRFYTLWQCMKLVFRFNFLAAFFRYYGNRQIKRWEAANHDFAERIKSVGERTRDLARSKRPAAERIRW